ncbi:MAG: competence protein ComEA [Syntrophomonadaceae bacterium]|nr:competence protein ComEA [Syntrophomonadaceae bacterium]
MADVDKRILAGFAIIMIITFAAGVKYSDMKQKRLVEASNLQLSFDQEADPPVEIIEPEEKLQEIKAYVTGAVERPGVYSFATGARIYEALELAGILDNAELRFVEMARVIEDEETIYIPAIGESEVPSSYVPSTIYSANHQGKININKATSEELAANLSGIGPVLAQRIVDYRDANGSFKTIEEIKNVSGIGDKRYEDLKDSIIVK